MKPLVSILIPAYNAEKWIGYTLQSAVNQTWPRKEIIVVDDGSTDGTAEVANQFASSEVKVISTKNQGVAAAENLLFDLSQGEYLQILAADDLLAPRKIEMQLAAVRENENKRILLSGPWAYFFYRTSSARFVPSSLWQDLSPVEWLLRKLGENLHMQPATWLTSRELIVAAGRFDTTLQYDDDGEYFCRVLLASQGTRFIPGGKVFYRASGPNRISYIGGSDKKRESLLRSMKLHVQYLRSLEDSDRVQKACMTYLRSWSWAFYPERLDMFAELQALARQLGGQLETPRLTREFAWMEQCFGWPTARKMQLAIQEKKASVIRSWDKAMFEWENRKAPSGHSTGACSVTQRH